MIALCWVEKAEGLWGLETASSKAERIECAVLLLSVKVGRFSSVQMWNRVGIIEENGAGVGALEERGLGEEAVRVGMAFRMRSMGSERRVWKWYRDRKMVLSGNRRMDSASGEVTSEGRCPEGEDLAWR